jgi:hypothetical protein
VKNCAQYVAAAKVALGDPRMSDRELGERLGGFGQSNIARAKAGYMTDPIAIELGELLRKRGVIEHAAEVVLIARAEREKDQRVRHTMLDYWRKRSAPRKSHAASAGAVALSARTWDVAPV